MMKREVQQKENRDRFANALIQIFQEKKPDHQLQLIRLQLQQNLTDSLTKQKQPHIWAALNLIAADAYSKLHGTHKQEDINSVAEYYENALQVITKNKYPYEWAAAHNNLAKIFLSQSGTEQVDNSEKAIAHAHQALHIRVRQRFPYHWAITQSLLAKAYYERHQGDRTRNLLQSAALFKQVLEVLTHDAFPEHFMSTVDHLCQVLFELKHYSEALFYIKAVLEINENQLGYADLSSEEMQRLVMQVQDFFSNAVWAATQIGDYETAFHFMEWSKGRMLRKNLALDILDLRSLPISAYEEFKNTEQERQRLIAQLEKQSEHSEDIILQSHLIEEIKSKNQQKQMLLEKHNTSDKSLPVTEDLYQWLDTLPSDSTLIAPVFSNHGTVIFILPSNTASIDQENILVLPEFTRKDLLKLIRGEKSDKWGGYISTYAEWKNDKARNFASWQSQLEISLNKITESWLHPVLTRLKALKTQSGSRLIWILDSDSSMLPIHSAVYNGQPLIAQYNIQFVPSLYNAYLAQQRLSDNNNEHLLVVVNPTLDLPSAALEGQLIGSFFASKTQLLGSNASHVNFNKAINRIPGYLHMATHGAYDWKNPLQSGLKLADDKTLTLANLLNESGKLIGNRLVVLSACETGLVDINIPAESLGLPSAFIHAGAPGVISTLWEVEDNSTAILMVRFYQLHREQGLEPAIALTQAQMWLQESTYKDLHQWLNLLLTEQPKSYSIEYKTMTRSLQQQLETYDSNLNADKRPFASRYYWAGFVYNGM